MAFVTLWGLKPEAETQDRLSNVPSKCTQKNALTKFLFVRSSSSGGGDPAFNLPSTSHPIPDITTPRPEERRPSPLSPTSTAVLFSRRISVLFSSFLPPLDIAVAQSWPPQQFLKHPRLAASPCPPTRQCGTEYRPGSPKTRPLFIPSPVSPLLLQAPVLSIMYRARVRYVSNNAQLSLTLGHMQPSCQGRRGPTC